MFKKEVNDYLKNEMCICLEHLLKEVNKFPNDISLIVINSFLGKRGDIDLLDNEIIIYRGTSLKEYESGTFSQSWSLDESIAKEFAFVHYRRLPNLTQTDRVLIKTKIKKSSIFYYDKDNNEKEIIVNPNNIKKEYVEKSEERILE